MIEINLLPAKVQKAKGMQQYYYLLGLGAVVIYAFLGFLYFTARAKGNQIAQQIEQVKKEEEILRPVIDKIEKIRAAEKVRHDKLVILKAFVDKQVFWLRVAQDMADAVPENLWLLSVHSQGPPGKLSGMGLEIRGNSSSKTALADFLSNLHARTSFGDVVLLNATDSRFGQKSDVISFTVTCKVTLPG